jgi:hypothetical protein
MTNNVFTSALMIAITALVAAVVIYPRVGQLEQDAFELEDRVGRMEGLQPLALQRSRGKTGAEDAAAAPPAPAAAAAPKVVAPGLIPTIVELATSEERVPQNGGSAVVIFAGHPSVATRNHTTCLYLWDLWDHESVSDRDIGRRRTEEGRVQTIRPLYWLMKSPDLGPHASCERRLAGYDYARATVVRRKHGLVDSGPYLIVSRKDEKNASVIDLTGRSDREIAALVGYFRTGFVFEKDIWSGGRSTAEDQAALASRHGENAAAKLATAIKIITKPPARSNCPLGDLMDKACG